MNEDFSEAIAKFKNILNEKNVDLPSILGGTNNNSNSTNRQNAENFNNSAENSNGFDFDINTILKIKNMIGSVQEKNSPRIQLLNALKPFLHKEKQEKLNEYIKLANIIAILEIFGENRR